MWVNSLIPIPYFFFAWSCHNIRYQYWCIPLDKAEQLAEAAANPLLKKKRRKRLLRSVCGAQTVDVAFQLKHEETDLKSAT